MIPMDLSLNEKRLLATLKGREAADLEEIAAELGSTTEAALQFATSAAAAASWT